MKYICLLICLCFDFSRSMQYYDQTLCYSDTNYPGTSISNLFKRDPNTLLSINNVSTLSQFLETGHEVLVPATCSCTGKFSQVNINYTMSENGTLSGISCEIFEGLVKYITLAEENLALTNIVVRVGSEIKVPLKCACPDSDDDDAGIKYLVTYPFIKGDDTKKLSEKFNVSVEEIWKANHLEPTPTVYPNTTVLVPLKEKPFMINFNLPDSDPPTPQFLPTIPVEKTTKNSQLKKLYIVGSVVGFCLILALLVACGLYINALNKFKNEHFGSSTIRISSLNSCSTPRSYPFSGPPARSSTNSCLSPDLLIGIKYSLWTYTMEEIKQATKNFCSDSKIGNSVYKGLTDNGDQLMIKEMRFEATKQVIDVHSKINHVNIAKLRGVCYGEDDFSLSYLVFEFPYSGSLRDSLETSAASLNWHRRTQIAFDVATGLHYLHYSVVPAYTHSSINSKAIFLTSNWRAKITVFGAANESGTRTWTAPEFVLNGLASEKVDIFAFGGVLLELISGKEAIDGKSLKESLTFLGGRGNEGGCFDQLRNLVDPCLKDDYPIAAALCLAVLASSCVEEDPMHRPSMDDILKILARMV